MQIPQYIVINGIDYKVVEENHMASGDGLFGQARFIKQEIAIDKELSLSRKFQVLLHEIIEVINMDCELKLEHNQITTLATQLYQVLKNNEIDFTEKEEDDGNEEKSGEKRAAKVDEKCAV